MRQTLRIHRLQPRAAALALIAASSLALAGHDERLEAPDAEVGNHGRICVAPTNDSAVQLDAETGNRRGYISYEFNFRVDRGPWIQVPAEKPLLVPGFDVGKKYLMTIREGERRIESFWFTFEGRGGTDLCLSYKSWYQTWLLEPPYNRPWCRCTKQ